jgi:KDO2-lipid IV(A) lauroyltransferase
LASSKPAMKGIPFIVARSLIWLVTLLPLPVLFVISDLIFFLLYFVVRYRRKVVFSNLERSFPEKPAREIKEIARKFYRHLTDSFIELVYPLNMSEKEHRRRYHFRNPDLLDGLYRQERDILLLMSHYGNWEWLSLLPRITDYTCLAIYKSLQNKRFDKFVLGLRSKYGVVGVRMESTLRSLIRYDQAKERVILYSLADQRPQWSNIRYWARFMNQDSPVLAGTEKLSRRFNMAVVFMKVNKMKRGCYEIDFVPVSMEPDKEAVFAMTRKYFDFVENQVREEPAYYLWSHNRWKYDRQPERNPVDIDEMLG